MTFVKAYLKFRQAEKPRKAPLSAGFCLGAVLWQTPLGLLSNMFGSIEAGGTKFVCGVGTGPADLKTMQFPTTSPAATLAIAIEFLRAGIQRAN